MYIYKVKQRNMEVLKVIDTKKVKKGCVEATLELCKTLKRNVKHSSADKRAGKWIADVYADVVFIIVNGKKQYFMHTTDMKDAEKCFEDEFRRWLPKF